MERGHEQSLARERDLALLGTLVVGIGAMVLRIRHASLAPAIALHCGNNFVACIAMVLG
jgi:membrane protease YdiL (CAAX protease family)